MSSSSLSVPGIKEEGRGDVGSNSTDQISSLPSFFFDLSGQDYAALAVSLELVELGKTVSSPWIRLLGDRAQLRRALATNNFDASPSSNPTPPPPSSDDPFANLFPYGIEAPARPSSPGSDTSEVQLQDLPPTSSAHDAIFEQVGFDVGASSSSVPEEADGWQKVGGKGKK